MRLGCCGELFIDVVVIVSGKVLQGRLLMCFFLSGDEWQKW